MAQKFLSFCEKSFLAILKMAGSGLSVNKPVISMI